MGKAEKRSLRDAVDVWHAYHKDEASLKGNLAQAMGAVMDFGRPAASLCDTITVVDLSSGRIPDPALGPCMIWLRSQVMADRQLSSPPFKSFATRAVLPYLRRLDPGATDEWAEEVARGVGDRIDETLVNPPGSAAEAWGSEEGGELVGHRIIVALMPPTALVAGEPGKLGPSTLCASVAVTADQIEILERAMADAAGNGPQARQRGVQQEAMCPGSAEESKTTTARQLSAKYGDALALAVRCETATFDHVLARDAGAGAGPEGVCHAVAKRAFEDTVLVEDRAAPAHEDPLPVFAFSLDGMAPGSPVRQGQMARLSKHLHRLLRRSDGSARMEAAQRLARGIVDGMQEGAKQRTAAKHDRPEFGAWQPHARLLPPTVAGEGGGRIEFEMVAVHVQTIDDLQAHMMAAAEARSLSDKQLRAFLKKWGGCAGKGIERGVLEKRVQKLILSGRRP